MTKTIRTSLACLCAAFVSLTAAPTAEASANLLDPIRIWGPVTSTSTEGEDARFFSLDNQSGQSYQGELRITVSKVYTRVLDAVTGQPCPVEDIRPGETAYVYIGPAMTMSQPPMANASMILCNIPADFRVPDYLKVASLEWNEDRTEALLTSTGGEAYTVAADCETTPYLSANIVTVDDLTPGVSCLLWADGENGATRIINFTNPGLPIEELPMDPGWQKINNHWYFYTEDGSMAKGWITDRDKIYYLDPETGMMHKGFLTIDDKTYYLQSDGSLLTSPKLFTPDKNGVLQ